MYFSKNNSVVVTKIRPVMQTCGMCTNGMWPIKWKTNQGLEGKAESTHVSQQNEPQFVETAGAGWVIVGVKY